MADQLHRRPLCEARWDGGCTGRAEHLHEKLTRARGGSILDPANTVAVCWWCHARIHVNPQAATDRGLLQPSWIAWTDL